jgi:hypothetical protein
MCNAANETIIGMINMYITGFAENHTDLLPVINQGNSNHQEPHDIKDIIVVEDMELSYAVNCFPI